MISVFTKRKTTKTSVIVDFMSLVRKISMKRLNTIKDPLAYMWKKITDMTDADEMHTVYDNYLENSLKRHERLRKTAKTEPIEFVNLSRQSPVHVQLECFWACSVNKVNLPSISRSFFAEIAQNSGIRLVLSNCVTQIYGLRNCEMFCREAHSLFTQTWTKL